MTKRSPAEIKNLKVRMVLNPTIKIWRTVYDYFNIVGERDPNEILIKVNDQIDQFIYWAKEREKSIVKVEKLLKEPKPSIYSPTIEGQTAVLGTYESLGCEQLDNAKRIFDNIHLEKSQGELLIAPAGCGKTYILGSIKKNFIKNLMIPSTCFANYPILYVTLNSVVAQTKEVLSEEFGIDIFRHVYVINIEALRSSLIGKIILEETVIVNGEPTISYRWRKSQRPVLIIWDECHSLMTEGSLQSRIANALYVDEDECPYKTQEILTSATPGSRISEFKHFCLATHKELLGEKITLKSWSKLSHEFASQYYIDNVQCKPTDYHPQMMEDFINLFDDNITRIDKMNPKHNGHIEFIPVEFDNEDIRLEYKNAEEEHEKRKARISGSDTMSDNQKRVSVLASFTIFAKAAENCRRYRLAAWMAAMRAKGYAPVIGFRFKQTAVSIIRLLVEKYNWTRDDISIIWGGSTEALSASKKLAKKIAENKQAQEFIEEMDIDMEADLGLYESDFHQKTEEQLAWEKKYKLVSQTADEREREKKRFLTQASKGCFYSYKAGGAGISLHHQTKYPNALQRVVAFTPDYSEKLFTQAMKRVPRLTSASDTYMAVMYYKNSIETSIVSKCQLKLESQLRVTRYDEFAKKPERGVGTILQIAEKSEDEEPITMIQLNDSTIMKQLIESVKL